MLGQENCRSGGSRPACNRRPLRAMLTRVTRDRRISLWGRQLADSNACGPLSRFPPRNILVVFLRNSLRAPEQSRGYGQWPGGLKWNRQSETLSNHQVPIGNIQLGILQVSMTTPATLPSKPAGSHWFPPTPPWSPTRLLPPADVIAHMSRGPLGASWDRGVELWYFCRFEGRCGAGRLRRSRGRPTLRHRPFGSRDRWR